MALSQFQTMEQWNEYPCSWILNTLIRNPTSRGTTMESGGIKTGEMGSVNQFYPWLKTASGLTCGPVNYHFLRLWLCQYILETYYWKIHIGNILVEFLNRYHSGKSHKSQLADIKNGNIYTYIQMVIIIPTLKIVITPVISK